MDTRDYTTVIEQLLKEYAQIPYAHGQIKRQREIFCATK